MFASPRWSLRGEIRKASPELDISFRCQSMRSAHLSVLRLVVRPLKRNLCLPVLKVDLMFRECTIMFLLQVLVHHRALNIVLEVLIEIGDFPRA